MFPKSFVCNIFRSSWTTYPHIACSSQWNLGELMSHGSCRAKLSGPETALTPSLPRISYHSVFGFIVSSHAWHMCIQFIEQEFIRGIKSWITLFFSKHSLQPYCNKILFSYSPPAQNWVYLIFMDFFKFSIFPKKLYFSRRKRSI